MEAIKQEIISCIYENGENLITGPVLQEVLLDMVDDTNAKVASGSVPGDLVEKTGSWDDAADWVEDNSGSLVHDTDLDGYATEQWVEDQGYLKEVPEGYATTESLNELSESVAELSSSIPSVDLSGYATTESVNEATQSVKDWVEAKHYLTTASLSGSVTEESVQFMINDSTASMKEWVENQNYATETYVSESIANLDIPDTSGFVTTQSYNQDSASFDERINSISGSDLSGYATTESLNLLSESVAEDLEGKADRSDLPDLTGYATEQWVQEQGYLTEHQDISGLATTESLNQVSSSLSESIATISGSSVDLSGYATTESLNSLSESVAGDLETKASEEDIYNVLAGTGLAEPEYGEWTLYDAAKKDELLETSSSLSASIAAISASGGVDLSGYATTSSVNALSESVRSLGNQVNGFGEDLDTLNGTVAGLASTSSLNSLSESVASDIDSLEGSIGDLEQDIEDRVDWDTYDTEKSEFSQSVAQDVADLSASIAAISGSDLSGYATTESLNNVSQSLSASIAAISGSDLSVLANTSDPNNPVFQALATASFAKWGNGKWEIDIPLEGEVEGNVDTYLNLNGVLSPLQMYLLQAGLWKVNLDYDEGEDKTYWRIDTMECPADIYWGDNQIGKFLQSLGLVDWDDSQWYSKEPDYFTEASASFDQRINNITGSGVDLSGYATTASLNSLSQSVAVYQNSYISESSIGEFLHSLGLAYTASIDDGQGGELTVWTSGWGDELGNLPTSGEGYFWTSAPAIWRILAHLNLIRINADGSEDPYEWEIDDGATLEDLSWPDNPIGLFFANKGMAYYDYDNETWIFTFGAPDVANQDDATFSALHELGLVNWLPVGRGQWVTASLSPWKPGSGSNTAQIGHYVAASGNYAIAQGQGAKAYGSSSFAQGVATNATGEGELAAGKSNFTSSGQIFSVGVGDVEVVTSPLYPGGPTVIRGYNPVNQKNAISVITGSNPSASVYIIGVGGYDGTNPTPGVNDVATVVAQGGADLSGYATTASVNDLSSSVSDDFENVNARISSIIASSGSLWEPGTGVGAIKMPVSGGNYNTASGELSLAIGRSCKATGDRSFAQGLLCQAIGNNSHAQGSTTTASGTHAHAEGWQTSAEGFGSHTEGYKTKVTASNSDPQADNIWSGHAEGEFTLVTARGGHTEGYYTTASGWYSHAEGSGSVTRARYSHAEGNHTETSNPYEHAQGQYNATASNQIFSVGVGNSVVGRKNALSIKATVEGSGSVYIQGIGGYDGTNPQEGVNDLASAINQISSSGYTTETWTFILEDSSSVTKNIVVA